jgi:heme exporter protein D
MSEFLDMGGYAFYVWGSFGATVAVLAWNVIAPRLERARLRRVLRGEAAS